MVKVSLSRGDNVFNHIHESLRVMYEIGQNFDKREKIELDFTEVKWILPCAVILISGKVKEVITKGAEFVYIPPSNIKVNEWLTNIGFPLGDFPLTPKESNFVPLKYFTNNPGNINQVNEEATNLIKSMENKIPDTFKDSIKFILAELSDNIDQHSNFTFASLMAQYYPNKECLDLAVLDNGITIPFNFEKHDISFDKDSEAIKKALFGEVTTRKDDLMRGFGLRSCKDISTKGINGELHILSRKGLIIIKDDNKPIFHDFEEVSLKGTLIYFRLPTPKKAFNIYPYLEGAS